jgi:hypothetical protein
MSTRMLDESADLRSLRDMIYQLYEDEGMSYLPRRRNEDRLAIHTHEV